ncbi:Type II secretion system protein G [Pontiella desulfatans]|uniref:Type II secretion system protein G n=1 Tax=Pontiella desulfatans TaxID=2750659 RepID=A0A6C2U940_PONDE|nr:type II secretion system protein GspG [Pontiella desulfatans]VGO15904.1 Type II secretion system protein G [Pontiella desulfatans]
MTARTPRREDLFSLFLGVFAVKHPGRAERGLGASRKGFTILELLAVMAIIAVLAGIGATGMRLARRQAKESRAKADIETLRNALNEYRVEFGFYPEADDTFSNMVAALRAEQQKVMADAVGELPYVDPWQHPYMYYRDSEPTNRFRYSIWSMGQDTNSAADDINPAQSGY